MFSKKNYIIIHIIIYYRSNYLIIVNHLHKGIMNSELIYDIEYSIIIV